MKIYLSSATFDEIEKEMKVISLFLQFHISLLQVILMVPSLALTYAKIKGFMFILVIPKVTTEAALGLIGGTFGLFTGFSIISGVEIVFFTFKYMLTAFR